MNFDFLLDSNYVNTLINGLLMTLVLALIAVAIGSIFGIIPAFMRLSKNKVLRFIGQAYVEIIRGTPLLVQVLIIYSLVKLPITIILGIDLSSFIPGMLALIINASAYIAELIRGGIQSVDKGQTEAALSLGLTNTQTMRHVVMPQAIKNILPSLGNEFASLIKETSIFMYLGIAELMYAAQIVKNGTYRMMEVYIVTAVLYFTLTFTTARLMGFVEKKLRKHDER